MGVGIGLGVLAMGYEGRREQGAIRLNSKHKWQVYHGDGGVPSAGSGTGGAALRFPDAGEAGSTSRRCHNCS